MQKSGKPEEGAVTLVESSRPLGTGRMAWLDEDMGPLVYDLIINGTVTKRSKGFAASLFPTRKLRDEMKIRKKQSLAELRKINLTAKYQRRAGKQRKSKT